MKERDARLLLSRCELTDATTDLYSSKVRVQCIISSFLSCTLVMYGFVYEKRKEETKEPSDVYRKNYKSLFLSFLHTTLLWAK